MYSLNLFFSYIVGIQTINLFAIARNEFQTKGINDITTTFTNAEMRMIQQKRVQCYEKEQLKLHISHNWLLQKF